MASALFAGNPINAATGNKFETETDFVGAPNTQLSFARYYNSFDSTAHPLGIGWVSTYHRNLTVSGNTVSVTCPTGRLETFTKNASGVYAPDTDVTDTLAPYPSAAGQTGWKLVNAADTTEIYSLAGLLTSITTRSGLTTTLTYDASNHLTTVTGPFGHKLTFTYDAANRVSTMTVPDGSVFTYGYDAANNLDYVIQPTKTTRWYKYGLTPYVNLLTGIVDENGNPYATWTYDSTGRAISSQHAGGVDLTTISYAAGSSTVTDARGNAHALTLSTQLTVVKPTAITGTPLPAAGGKAFAYDANGFISSITDYNGNITTYVHDARGNEISRTEAAGTAIARTITTTWDPTFHLPTKIVEPLRTTQYVYDSVGRVETKTVTAGTLTRTWSYTYDPTTRQVATATDPDGNVTTYTYDAKADLATKKDALGHVWNYTSYDANGRLLSMTDPNGLVTAFTYDKRGRVLTRKEGTLTTTMAYDNAGELIKLTKPDASFLSYVYDAAHRLSSVTDALNNSTVYTYDAASNLTQKQVFDSSKTLRLSVGYAYDTSNRLHQTIGAIAGETTAYAYDAQSNLISVTDPLGHVTSTTYDALNRPSVLTDGLGAKTTNTYDAADHLISVKDPRGLTTTYTVNGLDETTKIVSPDSGTTTNTAFDNNGNVLSSTDARGKTTTYTFDKLGRPKTIVYADATSVDYTYDAGTYGIGHLSNVVDPAGTTVFTYDQHGRMLTQQQVAGLVTLTVAQTYDAYERLHTLEYPSGKTITYTYDTDGRVSALSTGASSITYVPFGAPSGWTEANGSTYARTFDQDGRITKVALGGTTNVQTLTYDFAGRITGLTETGLANKAYAYDNDNRLTKLTNGTAVTQYSYDADGNRSTSITSAGTVTYNYPATSNRLSSRSGVVTETDTYDASGNTVANGVWNATYNARGRLASVNEGGVVTNYSINAFGQRILKTGPGVTGGGQVEYVYGPGGQLLGEYDHSGTIIEETVWLGPTPVAVLEGAAGATVYSLSADWLDTPHIIQNASKQSVWTWDHLAFGDNGPNQNPLGLGTFVYNLRFPGQYADAETGTSYNINRDYNSLTGRYVQSDPLGLNAGINPYAYADANPLKFTDKRGLFVEDACLAECTATVIWIAGDGTVVTQEITVVLAEVRSMSLTEKAINLSVYYLTALARNKYVAAITAAAWEAKSPEGANLEDPIAWVDETAEQWASTSSKIVPIGDALLDYVIERLKEPKEEMRGCIIQPMR